MTNYHNVIDFLSKMHKHSVTQAISSSRNVDNLLFLNTLKAAPQNKKYLAQFLLYYQQSPCNNTAGSNTAVTTRVKILQPESAFFAQSTTGNTQSAFRLFSISLKKGVNSF
jgi:hypothetical protein